MGVHHLEIYRVKNGYMVWTVDLDNLPGPSDQYVAPTGEACHQLIEQLLPLEKVSVTSAPNLCVYADPTGLRCTKVATTHSSYIAQMMQMMSPAIPIGGLPQAAPYLYDRCAEHRGL